MAPSSACNGYIAKGYPITLLHNDWSGFPRQRQFALDHATQPWCLSIDPDERVDDPLRQSIVAGDAERPTMTSTDGTFAVATG